MSIARLIKDLDAGLSRTRQGLLRHTQRHGDHSLRRKLLIGMGIAIACTSALAASVIHRSHEDYVHARHNLAEVENYRLILDVANILSAERGPSNSVLGADILTDGPLRVRLAQFRARSDAALERLSVPYNGAEGERQRVPTKLLAPVLEQLAFARNEVDRLSAIPREQRPLEDVQSVIESCFKVIDIFQAAIRWKVATLSMSNPDLTAVLLNGHIFGDLREYGGRIASQIMAPIAVSQPLPLRNLVDSNRTRGRLIELWHLIGGPDTIRYHDPRLVDLLRDADRQFFGEGLKMTDELIAQGRETGNYTMSADEYTVRFVQTLAPLERLRSAYLDITMDRVTADQRDALMKLTTAIAVTTIILATLAGLILVAQRYVFGPLLRAREEVICLAEDRPMESAATRLQANEMNRLFDAIDVLRSNLVERASLTRQLKRQAETDGLTGLMNRRALDLIGESQTSNQVMASGACLVLMDIDNFKTINDTHGHLAGDQVLNETACVVRTLLRANDIFARYGGEEFVLLISSDDLADSISMAERIRHVLEAHAITMPDGTMVNITASFGVAKGHLGRHAWPRLIEAADKALYRAKSDGRNCVRPADDQEDQKGPDVQHMASAG
ncbi:MAG: GGDEF domain-containing protein [Xanthobacteraceae bacterium]|nr:GGDEF domain-containing protein [Xanthobacteraceae bacterium]